MKKVIGNLLLLVLALSAVSCTLFINQNTPKGYVRYAVYLLDRDGLYADGAEWEGKRTEVLKAARSIASLDEAHDLIQEAAEVAGGNMYPMITSVSPLLPDGIVLQFKSRKKTTPIPLGYVTESYQIAPESIRKFPASTPVAVLTDDRTGSSGEATLICFLGLDNVKTFGGPTAGYPSGNVTHTLADGYLFAITRSAEIARTGEVFCEDPINPDVITDTPLEDAVAWIESLDQ